MKYDIRVSFENNEKNWNDDLKKNNISSAYQTVNWSKVYQDNFNSKPVYFHAFDSKGVLVGQLSTLIHNEYVWKDNSNFSKKIFSSLNLGSMLLWNYGPIIHDSINHDSILNDILYSVEKIAKKNNVALIRGSTTPNTNQHSSIFTSYGYDVKKWQSYVIDLNTNSDDFYSSLDKKTRYDIRKSEEMDFEFEIISSKKSLLDYSKLSHYVRTSKGEKRKKDFGFIDHVWNNLFKKKYLQVTLVKNNKKVIGGIWNIIFNNNIIQQGVENLPMSKSGGTFLTWNTLKSCFNSTYQTYDMGGSNPEPKTQKEKQIDFYKSKWGGKKLQYNIVLKKLKPVNLKMTSLISNPLKLLKK